MSYAIALLAAGNSVRFGSNKLIYPLNGKAMYRHVVDQIAGCQNHLFSQKLLVTQYQELADEMRDLDYQIIWNHNSCAGISYSIKLAVNALAVNPLIEGICFAVCDQPNLQGKTIEAFMSAFAASGKGMGCLGDHNSLGNPAVFKRCYFNELLSLTGDTGGKQVIRKYPGDLFIFPAQPEELEDYDQI